MITPRTAVVLIALVHLAFSQEPHDDADFKLAADLYRRGLHWEAETAFRSVTEKNPEFGQAWFGLAMCHYETRRLQAALPLFERAEACPRPEAQAFTNHAVTLELLSRADEARVLLERAVKVDPKHANAWLNLGKIDSRRGETSKALEHLERCVELEPGNVEAHYHLASLAFRAGETALARSRLKRVLELDPRHVGGHHLAARAARRAGAADEAKRLLASWRMLHDAEEKRRSIAGKVAGLMPLAFDELRHGRLPRAVDYFAEVLALDLANPHARSVLAQIARKLRDTRGADDAMVKRISDLLAAPAGRESR